MILNHLVTRGISDAFPNEVSIDFDALGEGIICFVGDNQSGKTHLLELSGVGTTHRWLPSYGEPIWSHVDDDTPTAFSDLTFTIGEHQYRCKVQIDPQPNGDRKTEAWLWRDGEKEASEKVSAVDRELAKVLPGVKLQLATNVACQSRDGSLFKAVKAEKKKLFIKMLLLERLELMAKAAGARNGKAEEALAAVRREMAVTQAKVTRLEEIEQHLSNSRVVIEQLEAARRDAAAAQASAAATLAAAREALAAAEATAAASTARQAAVAEDIARSAEDLDTAAARVATLEASIAAAPTVHTAAARLADLDAERHRLAEAIDERRAAQAPLDTEAAELKGRLDGLLADHGRLKGDQTAAAEAAARVALAGDVDGTLEAARTGHAAIAATVAERQEALPGLEAADEVERAAAAQRTTLLARRADLEPRTGLLAGIDVEHPMCGGCPLTADARAVTERIAVLDAELATLAAPTGATEALRTARRELAAAEQTLRAAARALADAEAAVAGLRADRDAAARVEAIAEALASNVTTGKTARARQQEITALRAALQTEIDQRVTQRSALDAERLPLVGPAARVAEIAAAETQIDEARAARDRLADRLVALRTERDAFVDVDLTAERAAVAAAAASSTKFDQQLATIDQERAPLAEQQQRLQGERDALGDVAGTLATLRARESELAADAADWAHLERAFGPNGIQALEISAAGPAVTAIANDLLSTCFRGRWQVRIVTTEPGKKKGVVKEVFDVVLIDGKTGRVRRKTSGGGMVVVEFAMRLAMSIYNAQRSGFALRTLWLDEVDGALSTKNATRYIRMLRRARELGNYHQILMISHSPAVSAQADLRLYVGGGRVSTTPLDDSIEDAA